MRVNVLAVGFRCVPQTKTFTSEKDDAWVLLTGGRVQVLLWNRQPGQLQLRRSRVDPPPKTGPLCVQSAPSHSVCICSAMEGSWIDET